MKNLIYLSILFIFFVGCNEISVRKAYFPNGQLKEEDSIKNGKLNGLCINYYQDGKLEKEYSFSEGLKSGPFKAYYENGQIDSTGFYKEDMLDSVVVIRYMNGKLRRWSQYRDGMLMGYEDRDEDGEVIPLYYMIVHPDSGNSILKGKFSDLLMGVSADTIMLGQKYQVKIGYMSLDTVRVFIGQLGKNDSLIWSTAKELRSYNSMYGVNYEQTPTELGRHNFSGIIQYKNNHEHIIVAPFRWSFYVKSKPVKDYKI